MLGVVFLLARLSIGLFLSRRLRRSSTPVDDPRAGRWLRRYAAAEGLQRAPELAESPAVSVPVTLGVRPTIVLPSGWRESETAKPAAVIAHEVSHARRQDSRTRTLALVYQGFSGSARSPGGWKAVWPTWPS